MKRVHSRRRPCLYAQSRRRTGLRMKRATGYSRSDAAKRVAVIQRVTVSLTLPVIVLLCLGGTLSRSARLTSLPRLDSLASLGGGVLLIWSGVLWASVCG